MSNGGGLLTKYQRLKRRAFKEAREASKRVETLEDRIRYSLDLAKNGLCSEAEFELDRALSDPDLCKSTNN
jgi:hypothetical protein